MGYRKYPSFPVQGQFASHKWDREHTADLLTSSEKLSCESTFSCLEIYGIDG